MLIYNLKPQNRKFVIAISTLMIIACSSKQNAPQWFVEQNITPNTYEYLGYGAGTTLEEAEATAKADIASTLNSHVQSSLSQSLAVNDSNVEKKLKSQLSVISDITLSNVTKKRSEHIGETYYTAYSYLNIPLAKKIKNEVNDTTKCYSENHPYLSQTPLYKELAAELPCLPKLTIIQQHSQFYLNFDQHSFPLSPEDKMRLFTTIKSPKINLQLSNRAIESGQYYHVNITPMTHGFLSLVQQDDDGKTQLLIDNMAVTERQRITYPDLIKNHGLEGYNPKSIPIQDLTLAILCKKPIDIAGLPAISKYFSQDNTSFFNYLMDISKQCSIASQTISTQPAK